MSKDKLNAPTLLRGLKIKSVSVVDQGANQHAHIRLAKRAEDEDGPDGEKQVERDTAFFARIGQAVAKMLHISPKDEVEKKDAKSFTTIDGGRQMDERIYSISGALSESLRSIIGDDDLTDAQKAEMIADTADQAARAIKSDIGGLFNGAPVIKADDDAAEEAPDDGTQGDGAQDNASDEAPDSVGKSQQEGETDMRFNMEAMTPEERAQLEDLQKRFGVAEETPAQEPPATPTATADDGSDGDIYKGINPAVKAEIEALRKFREEAEEREIMDVAKRYAIIGKKPEELAPVLKGLKAAGGTAYADMIAVLDSAVQAVEASGVFGEIGKRGAANTPDDAWGKIEAAAQEIAKSNTGLSYAQAIDKACMEHPDLVEAYEKSRR